MTQIQSSITAVKPRLVDNAQVQDNRTLIKAIIIGVAAELILVIFAVRTPAPAPATVTERPVMYAELVKPIEPPKLPPPPQPKIKPKVQKIISHRPAITPPKPQPPTPVPEQAPMIPVAQIPAPTAPSVATSQASTPVVPPKSASNNALVSIGIVCPVQTQPEMPEVAESEDITGSVTARATIRHGKVVRVEIIRSNPKGIFDRAVRQAMMSYQCDSNSTGDVVAEQTFKFSLSE
ncbi:MAG: energy transducer TonB [Sulfuriferula sp.]